MDGIPGEIFFVFGGIVCLMVGAACEDIKNYVKEKAHEGGKRKKKMFFKRLKEKRQERIDNDEYIKLAAETQLLYNEILRSDNVKLKKKVQKLSNEKAYLQDDNVKLIAELGKAKKVLEDKIQENKNLRQTLCDVLRANGTIKRGAETTESIFTKKEGKVNA